MDAAAGKPASHAPATTEGNQVLFWGCFIALVTTAFGFIARMFLIGTWAGEFKLDPAEAGRLAGIGIWPFAVSIIGFSLLIDKIGYKVAMVFAFLGHLIWAVMGVAAYFISHDAEGKIVNDAAALSTAYQLLYWGSLILGLANGTVEAFINPVVATLFSREKTKWLNILHAGWPGGLVVAGMVTIFIDHVPWYIKVGILAVPAVVYFVMLIGQSFPVQEREAAGVTYKDMLSEFGVLGAAVVGFLVSLQLIDFFQGVPALCIDGDPAKGLTTLVKGAFGGVGLAIVAGFGLYTQALGRPLMFLLVLVMIPLATTEIGTDGWITGIMEGALGGVLHPGWVLVYTSVIMMILRFFAGPIIHALSPLPLLALSACLAIGGLYLLSTAQGLAVILGAATLYGFGKTFFWPTMLGVVSEQTPKGGALTLNAISGVGMLAVGTLGFPFIGTLQADKQIAAITASDSAKKVPGLLEGGKLVVLEDKSIYEIIKYHAINDAHLGEFTSAGSLFPGQAGAYAKAQNEKKFDKNGDGKLDEAERKALDEAEKKETAEKIKKYDTNGDGKLDAKEAEAMEKKMAEEAKEWADGWAKRWDANKNWADTGKKLEPAELAKMFADETVRQVTWLTAFDADKNGTLSDTEYAEARKLGESFGDLRTKATQGALANMAIFPMIMLAAYIGLIIYFQSIGGYKAVHLEDAGAGDGKGKH